MGSTDESVSNTDKMHHVTKHVEDLKDFVSGSEAKTDFANIVEQTVDVPLPQSSEGIVGVAERSVWNE